MSYPIKGSPNLYCDFWVPERGAPGAIHINRSLRTSDPALAKEREDELRNEAEDRYSKLSGHYVDLGSYTLGDALARIVDERWTYAKTGAQLEQRIETIIEIVGNVTLEAFSGQLGARTLASIRKALVDGRERSTVDAYMATLRSLLKYMQVDCGVEELVIPKIPMFNEPNQRTYVLHADDEIELFKLLDRLDPEFSDYCRFLLHTGMRKSEALSINFNTTMVRLQDREVKIDTLKQKANKPRTVVLDDVAYGILLKRKLAAGPDGRAWSWTPGAASMRFRRYRKQMGPAYDNREFCLHMFRHTASTRMAEAGVPINVARDHLGHSDAKMTMYYTHTSREQLHHWLGSGISAISVKPLVNVGS